MRARSVALLIVIVLIVAVAAYVMLRPRAAPETLSVDYVKDNGSLGSWVLTLRPRGPGETDQEYLQYRVLYAAAQSIAGPPAGIRAVRFPPGTHVLSASVAGSTAVVNLSNEVESGVGGSFGENGEFKGLVFTLTGIDGISSVQVLVGDRKIATLPGGNLELDAPLGRSDW